MTGRPRCKKAQEAVLEAANTLLTENGIASLTIEGIAKAAGVGKPTIYRWWPSLADIVLEVVLQQASDNITVPTSGSFQSILQQFLIESMTAINNGGDAHLRFLIAHAQKDEEFRKRFRENFTAERRAVLRSLFQHAIKQKQFSPEKDIELLMDIIFGAMWYRLLVGHAPIDERFAKELTSLALGS